MESFNTPYKNWYEEPPDSNIPLWRYMSFEKFFDLISTSSLYFCRTDKFIDQYEGLANKYTYDLINKDFSEFENVDEMRNQLKNFISNMKKITFVSCWHMNYHESLNMWNEYCSDKTGIAIKTDFFNLKGAIIDDSLGPIFLGPVKYANQLEENADLRNFVRLLCYKRPEFKHENEFRAFLTYIRGKPDKQDADTINIQPPEKGQKIRVDLHKLIKEVYLHPNCLKNFAEEVANLIDGKLNIPINKSTLGA